MAGQSGNHAKGFVPGLVLGLVIGAFAGAVLPPLLSGVKLPQPADGEPRHTAETGAREGERELPPPEAAPDETPTPGPGEGEQPASDETDAPEQPGGGGG